MAGNLRGNVNREAVSRRAAGTGSLGSSGDLRAGNRRAEYSPQIGPNLNSDFRSQYEQIRQRAEERRQQQLAEDRAESEKGRQRLSPFERMLKAGMDVLEGGDADEPKKSSFQRNIEEGDIPGTVASFFVEQVPSELGSWVAAPGKYYEGITGKRISEADDQGLYSSDELNANQRAAQIVNAAVDTLDPITGAGGKIIDTARNVLGKGGRKAAKGAWGTAKSILGDMASEGAEEAVQSVAEDVRYDQWDPDTSWNKALESAAYGAIGGGIMSGMAHTVDHFAGRDAPAEATAPQQQDADSARSMLGRMEAYSNRDGSQVTAAASREMKDQMSGSAARRAGGGSMTVVTPDEDLEYDQSKIGTYSIRAQFENSNDEGRQAVANMLNWTPQQMAENLAQPDWEDRLVLQAEETRVARGGENRYMLNRTPATKNGGDFSSDLVGVFKGSGVMGNQVSWSHVGGDGDGDMAISLYNDDGTTNFAPYLSETLVDPVTGQATDTLSMSQVSAGGNSDEVFDRVLRPFMSLGRVDEFKRRFNQTMQYGSQDWDAYANLLTDIRNWADEERQRDRSLPTGKYVVNKLMAGLTGNMAERVSRVRNYTVDDILNEFTGTGQRVEPHVMEVDRDAEPDARGRTTPGTLGSSSLPIEFYEATGWQLYSMADKGSPIYRQYGEQVFDASAVRHYIDSMHELTHAEGADQSIISQLIAISLRERSVGGDVQNSIESAVSLQVVNDVMYRLTRPRSEFSGRLREKSDVDALSEAFCDAYNHWAAMYNKAIKAPTTRGLVRALGLEAKPTDVQPGTDRFYRLLGQTFGDFKVESLFDCSGDPDLVGRTLGPVLDECARESVYFQARFHNQDNSVRNLFNKLVEARAGRKKFLSKQLTKDLTEISRYANEAVSRLLAQGEPDPSDVAFWNYAVSDIQELVGPATALEAGFYSFADFMDPRYMSSAERTWATEIASGNEDRVRNGVVSMSLMGQYRRPLEAFEAYRTELERNGRSKESDRLLDKAMQLTSEVGGNEYVHTLINTELMDKKGRSALLSQLVNLDVTYASKQAFLSNLEGGNNVDLLVDALVKGDSEIDLSEIRARKRKASTAKSSAEIARYDALQAEVNRVAEFADNNLQTDQYGLHKAIVAIGSPANVEMTDDVLGSMVRTCATTVRSMVEKGVSPTDSRFLASAREMLVNGSSMPWANREIGANTGLYSLQEWAGNRREVMRLLSDADYQVELYTETGREIVDRQWLVRRAGFPNYNGKDALTNAQVIGLLRKIPQLASTIAPVRLQVSEANGEANMSNKNTQTLSGAISSWYMDRNAIGSERESSGVERARLRRIRSLVRASLLRDNSFMSAVVRMVPNVRDNLDQSAITERTGQAVDRLVNVVTDLALTTGPNDFDRLQSRLAESIEHEVTSSFNAAARRAMDSMVAEVEFREGMEVTKRELDQAASDMLMRRQLDEAWETYAPNVDRDTGSSLLTGLPDSVRNQYEMAVRKSKELVDVEFNVLAAAYYATGDIDGLYSFRPSQRVMAAAEAEIQQKLTDGVITQEQADNIRNSGYQNVSATIRGKLSDAYQSLTDVMLPMTPPAHLVDDGNGGYRLSSSPELFKSTVEGIAKKIAETTATEYDPTTVDGILASASPEEFNRAYREFRDYWNRKQVRNLIQKMNFSYDANINENIVSSVEDFTSFMTRAVADAKSYLVSNGEQLDSVFEERPEVSNLGELDFTDQVVEGMANTVRILSESGFVPNQVGLNGGESITVNAALGALPIDNACGVGPTMHRASEILTDLGFIGDNADPSKWMGYSYYAGDPSYYDPAVADDPNVRTIDAQWANDLYAAYLDDPDTEVAVFARDECQCGNCRAHTPSPLADNPDGFSFLQRIMGTMGDFSQEGMVLKAKKETGVLSRSIDEVVRDPRVTELVFGERMGSDYATVSQSILIYRKAFEDRIYDAFQTERASGMGFGRREAVAVSQFLTPAVYLNFTGPNGQTRKVLANVRDLYMVGEERFNQKVAEIAAKLGDGWTLRSTSMFRTTREEMALHIQRGLVEMYGSQDDLDVARFQQAAQNIATDWEGVGGLSFFDFASAIRPYGTAYDQGVTASDAPSYLGALMDASFGQRVQTPPDSPRYCRPSHTLTEMEAKAVDNISVQMIHTPARESLSGELRQLVDELTGSGDNALSGAINIGYTLEDENSIEEARSRGLTGFPFASLRDIMAIPADTANVNAIALTESKLIRTIRWAEAYRRDVFAPLDVASRITGFNQMIRPGEFYTIGNETFVRLRPYLPGSPSFLSRQSKVVPLRHGDIEAVLVDEQNWYGIGEGAAILNQDTVGRMFQEIGDSYSVNLSALFRNQDDKAMMAGVSDLAEMRSRIAKGDWAWLDETPWKGLGVSVDSARAAVSAFVDEAASFRPGQVIPDSVAPGGVVAMMVKRTDKGMVAAPVLMKRNVFQRVADAQGRLLSVGAKDLMLEITGNRATVRYTYQVPTYLEDHVNPVKTAAGRMSSKGMSVTRPASEMPTLPGIGNAIDHVIDLESTGSRLVGLEERSLIDNLWYATRSKYPYNVLYQLDANGVPRMRANVLERFGNDEKLALSTAMSNDWAFFDDVETGVFGITGNADVDEIIANVVRLCRKAHIKPMDVLSSASVNSDGQWAFNDVDVDYRMVLPRDVDTCLKLFHAFDPNLCADGWAGSDKGKIINKSNLSLVTVTVPDEKGQMRSRQLYCKVFYAPFRTMGVNAMAHAISSEGSRSFQAIARNALLRDPTVSDVRELLRRAAMKMGDAERFRDLRTPGMDRSDMAGDSIPYKDYIDSIGEAGKLTYETFRQVRWRRQRDETVKSFMQILPLRDESNKDMAHPMSDPEVADAVNQLATALSLPGGMSYRLANRLYMYQSGHTFNDGKGQAYGFKSQFVRMVREMAKRVERGGSLAVAWDSNDVRRANQKRYPLALLPEPDARLLWTSPAIQRNNNGSFDQFKRSMMDEDANICKQMNLVDDHAKRNALYRLHDYAWSSWNLPSPTGHIYEDMYVADVLGGASKLMRDILLPEEKRAYRERVDDDAKQGVEKLANLAALADESSKKRISGIGLPNGNEMVTSIARDSSAFTKTLSNVVLNTRMTMAILSPGTFVGNMSDRFLHTGTMQLATKTKLGRMFGPYEQESKLDQRIILAGAKSREALGVWNAMRDASLDGDVTEMIPHMGSYEQLRDWNNSRMASRGRLQKVTDYAFQLANGGNILSDRQLQNWFNVFMSYEAQSGHDAWFETSEASARAKALADNGIGDDGVKQLTVAEARWATDPAGLLLDVFSGRIPESYRNARLALNEALKGDMAQDQAVYALFRYATRNHPAARTITLLSTTPFMRYGINKAGRVLNWVMPISTTYHVFCDLMSKTRTGQRMGIAEYQTYPTIKAAIKADVVHMGITPALLAMIVALSGALTPPDDDSLAGNPDEWLLFGRRLGEDWELSDLLGMAKPMACFYSSCMNGQPRFDLIANGLQEALYNNPVMTIWNAVDCLLNPDEAFTDDIITGYEDAVEQFSDAPGGPPTLPEYIIGNGVSTGLTFVGSLFTPAFVREYFADDVEHSYTRIYAESDSGAQTESGAEGYTEKTTFMDAMVRKATRRNPFLGALLDVALQPETGYMEGEMPYFVSYDAFQLGSAEFYSLRDEAGNPLPQDEQEARILQAIAVIDSYDDMEALYQTGFYLNSETRNAVAQTVWDIVYDLQQQELQLQEDGYMDYYAYGDYNTGQRTVAGIRQYFDQQIDYWTSFYYDKLSSEPLNRDMTAYRRYKTTFAEDEDGNIYATGYRQSALSPILTAPGTLEDPEGTAGYEGNWSTVSAVTGQPLGERALYVADESYNYLGSLESHSRNGDGSSYSSRWTGGDYQTTTGSDLEDLLAGFTGNSGRGGSHYNPYRYYRSPYRRYGYRSYGRGGGGGGGGGYSPNLYSRLPSINLPSARSMYADRMYDSSYNRLYPDFETKGSREAYKRSDI